MLMDYLHRFGLLFSSHLLLLMFLETKTICGDVPPHYWETPYSQPYFDNSSRREVTATVDQAALMHCRVRNLGDRAHTIEFALQKWYKQSTKDMKERQELSPNYVVV